MLSNVANLWRGRASLLLMMASGFAGLGYQIVWTQQCALWLGHEAAAVLAVVTAFFGGLALGALLFGPSIESSARPLRWYATCELIIALWSLVLALAMSPVSRWMLDVTGAQPTPVWQWTIAFCGTFLLLFPATAAMGATLPAMERVTAQLSLHPRSIAMLYAGNTFGAMLGVLAIAFWLAPTFGLLNTAMVCVALNVFCAATAWRVLPATSSVAPPRVNVELHSVLLRLAMTGLLGIGYEVLVVRVLSEVAEDTVYTFAMLLAVYLVGSALGAAAYQRWLVKARAREKLRDQLSTALAIACLMGIASLWGAEQLKALALQWFGTSMAAAIGAEALLAVAAFGLPTLVMGALFNHLSVEANAVGVSFGRALGINTLGAAIAPLLFGVLALPMLGAKLALLLICIGYLALTPWRRWARPFTLMPAGLIVLLIVWAPPLAFIEVPSGGHVVSYQEGVMAAVSVVADADDVMRLRINNRQQEGSSASLRVDGRQAWLPLLLHPAPRRALFLGLGTGVTASVAATDPGLQVDAVELLPEVITASKYFTNVVNNGESHSRLNVMAADARRYVRTSADSYDVIVADNFHPARSGSGSLYTVEHFTAVRTRLAAGGVFCQWLPLHQLDLQTLRSIVQSFIAVYPDAQAMLANNSLETPVLGLVGHADDARVEVDALHARLQQVLPTDTLIKFGLEDEFSVLGNFIAGPEALHHFAASSAINTDDHPIVAYLAPRITYSPDSLPRERLVALLNELTIKPDALVASSTEELFVRRLANYWQARNQFIHSGQNVRPARSVQDMLAQVREPLLSVLRISPDFRPAYDPLLLMANALAQTDVAGARALLTELMQLQPARPEAALALQQMGSNAVANK